MWTLRRYLMSKWTLYDPVSAFTYTFQINPNSEVLSAAKTLTYEATAAPSQSLLLYEGSDQPSTLTLTGTLLSQDQYGAMLEFYGMRNQVLLTDDLNRLRWVYFSAFNPTRVRSAQYPYKMTFSISLYVLSEVLPTGGDIVFNANPTIG